MATETLIQPAAAAGKDTHLAKNFPTTNYGTTIYGKIERDDGDFILCRTLFEFALGGLSISVGSALAFAALFWRNSTWSNGGARPVTRNAHRITAAWNEAQATWNIRATGTAWGTAGGDFNATPVHTRVEQANDGLAGDCWHCHSLTQLVRDWLDAVYANYGVLIKFDAETAADTWSGLRTSDAVAATDRPFLWVENFVSPMHLLPIAEGYHKEWTVGNCKDMAEAVRLPPSLAAGVPPLDLEFRGPLSGIVGTRQSFTTTGNVPSGAAISSVIVHARVIRRGSPGGVIVQLGVRVAGTTYMNTVPSDLIVGWTNVEREWTTNPATGSAWTTAQVNAMEPVIQNSGGTLLGELGRLYVRVTYVQMEGEKDGADGAQATETSNVAPVAAGTDAAATDKERAGYYRWERLVYPPEYEGPRPTHGWKWYPGVEAFLASADAGIATEGAGQVVHKLLAGSDAGILTDAKVDYPLVEHLRIEPAAGVDLADLWWDIAVQTDSGTAPEEEAVVEINPILAGDGAIGTEGAAERFGLYDRSDGAIGVDAATDIWAVMAASPETAVGVEVAERVGLLSRHILRCSIESTLATLADSLSLALVEADPADPLAPNAQSWLSFNEGDLVHVRLGLVGKGFDDYGIFRVDETNLERSPDAMVTTLAARDKAALLIEERGRAEGGFRFGPYDDEAQAEWTRPTSRAIARRLAAQVGLGLIWDAPNYPLKSFAIGRDESISAVLQRLLTPLQQSRRYRTDAWVDGDNLVVRRRGSAPVRGTIDCNLGMVTGIARRREPQWGDVDVWGGTEVVQTTYMPEEHPDEQTQETETVIVETEEQPDGDKVVSTRIQDPPGSGNFALAQRETTRLDFDEVFNDSGQWIGRVLKTETTRIDSDLHTGHPKHESREIYSQYDSKYRLVLLDERGRVYDAALGYWTLQEQKVTRYEQFTPTDVRTTITAWERKGEEMKLRKGFPSSAVRPGTLQSALQVKSLPHKAWEEREDGKQPTRQRVIEETVQYHGHADAGGALPRAYTDANLMSHSACQQIADDMAAESGKWAYDIELRWARPFQYRKGDRVTLTNLPGGLASLVATILSLRTTYDRQRSEWAHDVSLEAWADS